MTIAFVFPGQGSQAVGMGAELAKAHASARAVFEEVDAALGQKLSEIMFNGPIETLTLTENAQPALMAVSLAVMRVLEQEKGFRLPGKVQYVAGHSLGEYSALAAAGALSVADAARLLKTRGKAMQAAVLPCRALADGAGLLTGFGNQRLDRIRLARHHRRQAQVLLRTAQRLLEVDPIAFEDLVFFAHVWTASLSARLRRRGSRRILPAAACTASIIFV